MSCSNNTLNTFLQPINYEKIKKTIMPWINSIYNEEYTLFYRGFSAYLEKELPDSEEEKILLFLFFSLLPHFYKTNNESELLFIDLIRKTPKLDLEKTNESILLLYYTTACQYQSL